MPLADRLEITQIHASPQGDTRFPAIDPGIWRESVRESHAAGPDDDAGFDFVTYRRKAAKPRPHSDSSRDAAPQQSSRVESLRGVPYNPARKRPEPDGFPGPERFSCHGVIKAEARGAREAPRARGGQGPQSSGPTPPDLEELLRRSQDKLKSVLPGGNLGGRGIVLIVLAAMVIWGFSGFFRVEPDELGVVLRFGKYTRDAKPGLNYHLPYPIETVLTPKVTRVNRIDIGMRLIEDPRRSGTQLRDMPEESLMLTGDENIVDVDVSVFWLVKPGGAGEYLFNIQNPEGTVKAVAESAMREVIGRSEIQPILTGARQTIETAVHDLMQKVLDTYQAGIQVTQVQMQKVDPPAQVIDAFRDVQAARADLERAQNEAQTYANRVVPEARGQAAQIQQAAEAYREQTVAEAKGQAARFGKVYEQYKKAPAVTRQRIYLETMERVFGGTDKIMLDSAGSGSGQRQCRRRRSDPAAQRNAAAHADGRHPMKLGIAGGVIAVLAVIAAIVGYSALFTVYQTRLALVVRLGQPVRVVIEPGLNFKIPLIDSVIYVDKRILDLENAAQEVIASDQKRLVVDAFARYRIRDALLFYQSVGSIEGANSRLSTLLNAALRRVLGESTLTHVVRDERAALMARVREQLDREAANFGITVVDVRIRRADLPEQNSQAVYQRMQTERQREAAEFRAQRQPAQAGNPGARRP